MTKCIPKLHLRFDVIRIPKTSRALLILTVLRSFKVVLRPSKNKKYRGIFRFCYAMVSSAINIWWELLGWYWAYRSVSRFLNIHILSPRFTASQLLMLRIWTTSDISFELCICIAEPYQSITSIVRALLRTNITLVALKTLSIFALLVLKFNGARII